MPLKWIKTVTAKGKKYYYFDTGKRDNGRKVYVTLPKPSDPSFARTYATLLGHRNRQETVAPRMMLKGLIGLFEKSKKYRDLEDSSKRMYDTYLRRLEEMMPTAPVGAITRLHMQMLVDGMADTPAAANLLIGVSSSLFEFGKKREYVSVNPCEGIERFEVGEHQPWPVPVLEAALVADSDRVRLLAHLLYYTAQRVGDVLAMTWSSVTSQGLVVRQQKTEKLLTIPLHTDLAAELSRTPRRGLCIVTGDTGLPLSQSTARRALQEFGRSMGVDVVPHGLRKNAVNALLEAGCSVAQTQAVSGQSLQMVEHYAKGRNQQKLASAAILTWERNAARTGKTGEK